ncbi:MAG: hypothetical protein KatS3mg057_2049 [Herpetosiphonaceae bacterium]|nr:MAG: hypothetical protein KatS3mg057_2049 [Herpetosiphonaceae bacterium]
MTMELTTIGNIKQFLEVAELLEYPAEKIVLVLNKADNRLGLRVEQVEARLKHKVAAQIGNAPNEMTISINQGVPLVLDKRGHQTAKDLLALAALLSNSTALAAAGQKKSAQEQGQTESKGLLSRLLTKR